MRSYAVVFFSVLLVAIIYQTGALKCITCNYQVIVSLDGTAYTGEQPGDAEKDCWDKPKDFIQNTTTCEASTAPSGTSWRCVKANTKISQTVEGKVQVIESVSRGCLPLPDAIDEEDGGLTNAEIQVVFTALGIGTFVSGEASVCDKDLCNSANSFKSPGLLLCSVAVIMASLLKNF